MSVSPECMYVYHVCAVPVEVWMAVSPQVPPLRNLSSPLTMPVAVLKESKIMVHSGERAQNFLHSLTVYV